MLKTPKNLHQSFDLHSQKSFNFAEEDQAFDIKECDSLMDRLREIEMDLQTPYLEKKSQQHRSVASGRQLEFDIEDELKSAINEISEREKTCKQILQICQFFANQCQKFSTSTIDQTDLIAELQRTNISLQIQNDQIIKEVTDMVLKVSTLEQEIQEQQKLIRELQESNRLKVQEIKSLNTDNKLLKNSEKLLTSQLKYIERGDAEKSDTSHTVPKSTMNTSQQHFSFKDEEKENKPTLLNKYDKNSSASIEQLIQQKDFQIEQQSKKIKGMIAEIQEKDKTILKQQDKIKSLELQNSNLKQECQQLKTKLETIAREKEEEHKTLMDQQAAAIRTRKNSKNSLVQLEKPFVTNPSPNGSESGISPLNKQFADNDSFNGEDIRDNNSSPLSHAFFNDSPSLNSFKGFTLYQTNNESQHQYQTQTTQNQYFTSKQDSSKKCSCQSSSPAVSSKPKSSKNLNLYQDFDELVRESSIIDNHEDEIEKRLAEPTLMVTKKRSNTFIKTKRVDAEVEFFKMLVLAYKLNFPEMSKICQINSEKLYQRAKKEGVTFYKYHEWIEKQMNAQTLSVLYSFTKLYNGDDDNESQNLNDSSFIQGNRERRMSRIEKLKIRKQQISQAINDQRCIIM
ncbi:UNKNOWN [Stylonychia lemnae]|uniref:Uncharacterized protein n=1 Tax=Stylonychia lemnae TaxID=5949 RepID=A0A078ARF2_STYLE|nr:UNKNOWN [Stylonychia lemnae]|eukprot:CDW83423.1 UNKNOWN [Stylonychia lemnae]